VDSQTNSFRELSERKKVTKSDLRARLYLYNQSLIVSSVAEIAEYGPVTAMPLTTSDQAIGQAVCSHLVRFVPELPNNLRDQKSKDWQAFTASGAKSVKAFRAGLVMVSIETMKNGIFLSAQPYAFEGPSLYAGSELSLAADHCYIGAAVRRVLKAAAVLVDHRLFEETA